MLQDILIDKIKEHKGLEDLILSLEKYKRIVKPKDKIYFTTTIEFYILIYSIKVDVEQQTLDSKELITKSKSVFKKYNNKNPSEDVKFCIYTITLCLDYMDNIKPLP